MDHFSDEELIDFVRGVLEPGRRSELEAHLADDCPSCRIGASRWRKLARLAALTAQPVPEDAVQSAKAAYFLAEALDVRPETIQFASLVFDSHLSAAPAGARSAWFGPRHCVYESGGFTIEFHVGAGRENDKGFLTGQIADPSHKSSGLSGSQVTLVVRGDSVTKTSANDFGEFMLELTIHDHQWLMIEIPEELPIAIPIPDTQV